MLSHEEQLALAKPDPEFAKPKTVIEEDQQIPSRGSHTIPVRIYKGVVRQSGGDPLFIMIHGGGFSMGGLDTKEEDCRRLVVKFGFVVVNVDYRLAPEHPWPAAVEDCWDVVKWSTENAQQMGADPSKTFIVGGESAGANLSAVVSLLARDQGFSPPITGLVISIIPAVNPERVPERLRDVYLSYEQNANAPILDRERGYEAINTYGGDPDSFMTWPILHPKGLSGLPPTYMQVCGLDILRDDGLIYEQVLRESGVKTKMDIYPGLPHGFWVMWPQLQSSKKQTADIMAGVAWLLEQK
ncbi:Alpha/Beta hydrolase protein [Xylogone sp. PMI_703]|nr:Alpha/Beta hydrolase protein [Xylogone sp. PMI_703]